MSDVAITVEGLGKRYRIAHSHDRYGRLTESLWNAVRAPLIAIRGRAGQTTEWIWALRDVSFELRRGDVVGVIGRNGAGKTTLLKVLSRITEPSAGSATLRGRVGSLLEVGTGFHPELTGRENMYLSGAVLGMRRAEINRKFDEIVEFAGIEQFLDTPVKRYSSGMQVRLGFAVAAHLETEILFVDEVLAVGDAEFQKKCLGKMSEIGQAGRTVIFVSHSMPAMLRLCDRAILLDQGRVVTAGPTHAVVRTYLESDLGRTSERRWDDPATAPGDDVARLRSVPGAPGRAERRRRAGHHAADRDRGGVLERGARWPPAVRRAALLQRRRCLPVHHAGLERPNVVGGGAHAWPGPVNMPDPRQLSRRRPALHRRSIGIRTLPAIQCTSGRPSRSWSSTGPTARA